jgi:predicted DNA-binding protein with PD1-like motif
LSDLTGSRQKIRHPGPPAAQRQQFVRGEVRSFTVTLPAGAMLMAALTAALQDLQGETAFVHIDGLALRSGQHVLPAHSPDAQHVAWYSETHRMGACRFVHGTVVLGRKDDQWFSHCHALWETAEGTPGLGHVLCAEACIDQAWEAEIHVFFGGGLRVSFDAETNFSLLRPYADATPSRQTNALLLTLQPHEDVRSAINAVCAKLAIQEASIMGVGSLIGAVFAQGPAMRAAISEMLLLPGAEVSQGRCIALPVACVNPEAVIYQGDLLLGQGPVLITCELLLRVSL